ncbi:DHH family phosphoesterase [Gordonia insulae]|uniref:Bifunctional oligoribonuclease and PAP phosphatase NrnA n=1 Tax=Gordonia insulae TaxID=2420509 RepID=A0A3G8JGF7_9ACTN|nr:bifunctional oligoribonuclease/PAP phosphatase NrnA [Gordonia insulae]AZG44093.1 Bifunctional oligoribonuclease and PAP phosphatase NrnA [Gordonia insulae]
MTASTSTAVATELTDVPAVTILCHVRPDADTIGSGLALGLALDRLGVDVEVAFPDTVALPATLAGLPGAKLLVVEGDVVGHPVVVSVDAASLSRLDSLATIFTAAQRSVTIDHHASNDGFGDLDLIDPTADCTAVLVLSVLDAMGVVVDAEIATCLYAGLVTDTGSFRWARPESFRVAARLIDAGVDARAWSRMLLDTHPFRWFSMVSSVLGGAQLVPAACGGDGLVYAVIPHDVLSGMSWEESESVVDIVRTADEAEVAAVFKETGPASWTVSLRSKRSVDLVPIAAAHGGGGHRHASGYSDIGTADEVVTRLLGSL